MINVIEKFRCSGCGACYSACPAKCIYMKKDEEGFFYPKVDSIKCIHCDICEKVCPFINCNVKKTFEIPIYAVANKDNQTRSASSSGGFFSVLADYVFSKKGVVYGASFDEQLKSVNHIRILDKSDMYKLRNSKYIQSNIVNSYLEVKHDLIDGRQVLFTGTPCQIAGIKLFLQRDYDNLYTMEIICHGVPSSLFWNKYVEHLEKKYNSKITNVNFRKKKNIYNEFGVKKEKEYISIFNSIEENPFMAMYLKDICLRPSCYNCTIKNEKSKSDFTVGDCWGAKELHVSFDNNDGVSLVVINNNKASSIFEELKNNILYQNIDFIEAIHHNESYYKSSIKPLERENFYSYLDNNSFSLVEKKYHHIKYINRIKTKIKNNRFYKFFKKNILKKELRDDYLYGISIILKKR